MSSSLHPAAPPEAKGLAAQLKSLKAPPEYSWLSRLIYWVFQAGIRASGKSAPASAFRLYSAEANRMAAEQVWKPLRGVALAALSHLNPDPLDRLLSFTEHPDYYRERCIQAEIQFREMRAADRAAMQALRVPVPQVKEHPSLRLANPDATTMWWKGYVDESEYARKGKGTLTAGLTQPTFTLPLHLFCRADNQGVGYFVSFPSGESRSAAAALLDQQGLCALVREYEGVWLNRDPYQAYRGGTDYFQELFLKDPAACFGHKQKLLPLAAPEELYTEYDLLHAEEIGRIYWSTISEKAAKRLALTKEDTPESVPYLYRYNGIQVPRGLVHDMHLPPVADVSSDRDRYVALKVVLASRDKAPSTTHFLESLRRTEGSFGFELLTYQGESFFALTCEREHLSFVESRLRASFPDFVFELLEQIPVQPEGRQIFYLSIASKWWFEQMKLAKQLPFDPYANLFSALTELPAEEFCSVKFSFAPFAEPMATLLDKHLMWLDNDYLGLEYMRDGLKEKCPGWLCAIELSGTDPEALQRLYDMWFSQYQSSDQEFDQTLEPTLREVPFWNLFSTEELASLIHFPPASIPLEGLEMTTSNKTTPSKQLTEAGLLLGESGRKNRLQQVFLPHELRSRHCYVVGASGSGKSTLLINLIKQDIDAGRGFAVIDPHGELISDILPHIPKRRVQDTVLFNAADREYPVSLNPLQAKTEQERDLITSDFIVMFQRLFAVSEAPRLLHILRHTIMTLLEAGGKSFMDIRRMLVNADYRREVLSEIQDPYLTEFWEAEFPNLPKNAVDPITNKLSQFTLNSTVRGILGQSESRVNFFDLMQRKRIFLANLAQGDIQEENSQLLGSLLVSQIQLAAMRRSTIDREERQPFTLYIDEFQNYIATDSKAFEKILSEARKYNLGLCIAHQYTAQLDDRMRSAIFANMGTTVLFRVGHQDAAFLRPVLGGFTTEDVQNLRRGETVTAVPALGIEGKPFSMRTYPPPARPETNSIPEIIEYSRKAYASPKEEKAAKPVERTKAAAATEATKESTEPKKPQSLFDELFRSE